MAAVFLSMFVANTGAANAQTSAPTAVMACGGGKIMTSAPNVTARQNMVGSTQPDAFWQAQLYRWNGREYKPYINGDFFVTSVRTGSGPGIGGIFGSAGPTWYKYNVANAPGVTNIWFNVPAGSYAIWNITRDYDGIWTGAWARSSTNLNLTHCTL